MNQPFRRIGTNKNPTHDLRHAKRAKFLSKKYEELEKANMNGAPAGLLYWAARGICQQAHYENPLPSYEVKDD